MKAEGVPTHN